MLKIQQGYQVLSFSYIDGDFAGNTINGNDDFRLENGLACLESRDQVCEDVLRKIEVLQLQVRKLKAQIDKVVNENPTKFSSINRLSLPVPSDALTNSDQNPASLPENGDRMPIKSPYTLYQHMSESNMGDQMPESAVSSHGEVTPLPDMIDSKGQRHVGVSCENVCLSSATYIINISLPGNKMGIFLGKKKC